MAASQVIENTAAEAGGGAYVWYQATATLTESLFKENKVLAGRRGTGKGSGVYARCSSVVKLVRAEFESNPPHSGGGDDVFVDVGDDCLPTGGMSFAIVCNEEVRPRP